MLEAALALSLPALLPVANVTYIDLQMDVPNDVAAQQDLALPSLQLAGITLSGQNPTASLHRVLRWGQSASLRELRLVVHDPSFEYAEDVYMACIKNSFADTTEFYEAIRAFPKLTTLGIRCNRLVAVPDDVREWAEKSLKDADGDEEPCPYVESFSWRNAERNWLARVAHPGLTSVFLHHGYDEMYMDEPAIVPEDEAFMGWIIRWDILPSGLWDDSSLGDEGVERNDLGSGPFLLQFRAFLLE